MDEKRLDFNFDVTCAIEELENAVIQKLTQLMDQEGWTDVERRRIDEILLQIMTESESETKTKGELMKDDEQRKRD